MLIITSAGQRPERAERIDRIDRVRSAINTADRGQGRDNSLLCPEDGYTVHVLTASIHRLLKAVMSVYLSVCC